MSGTVMENVLRLAGIAVGEGADGVVASPLEVRPIKSKIGGEVEVVTPGVRPDWAQNQDQRRVLTPAEAKEAGADYIVVGRPIIKNEDPLAAAEKILAELKE
jgi:orotidine-5'-phosphate decarboxylase